MRNITIALFLVAFTMPPGLSAQSYSVLFYNVENLFYPEEDSLYSDKQYTPEGERHWTWYKYHQKVNALCKVILASGEWHYPDFIALCEIENRDVLEDIVGHPLLMKLNYGIVHRDSKDHRGMDVAILFRKERIKLLEDRYFTPMDEWGNSVRSRDILVGKFLLGRDTLVLSMNHWTSKYGGEMETEEKRCAQAVLLGDVLDSISVKHPDYYVLAGGDFNDECSSKSIGTLKRVGGVTELMAGNFEGTYKYRGKWGRIDHVFVGGVFEESQVSLRIVNLPFLLEKDEKNGGEKPKRSYLGYKYNGGLSDHLPLLFLFEEEGQ